MLSAREEALIAHTRSNSYNVDHLDHRGLALVFQGTLCPLSYPYGSRRFGIPLLVSVDRGLGENEHDCSGFKRDVGPDPINGIGSGAAPDECGAYASLFAVGSCQRCFA